MANIYQNRFWNDGKIITGNGFFADTTGSYQFNVAWYQSPAADGDTVEFELAIDPGDYDLVMFGVIGGISGIQEIYFDGVFQFSIDRFGPFTPNVAFTNSVTIINPVTIMRSVVNGRNPGSSDYLVNITRFHFIKP